MDVKQLLFITLLFTGMLAATQEVRAQACTTAGQTPGTAFPVCGTSVFKQTTVALCENSAVPTYCNDNAPYTDINPYYYKFTCFTAGTLGFEVTPDTQSDDYDW